MSQRPNVLRGGEAEGPPGRPKPWDTWLFSASVPRARAGQEAGFPGSGAVTGPPLHLPALG